MAWGGHASGRSGVCRILPGSPACSRRVPWPRPQGPRSAQGTPSGSRFVSQPCPSRAQQSRAQQSPQLWMRPRDGARGLCLQLWLQLWLRRRPGGPLLPSSCSRRLAGSSRAIPTPPGTAGAHLARGHRWRGAPSPARCPPVGRARPAPPQAALGGSGPDSDPSPGSDPDLGPGAGPGPDPARPGPAGQKRGPRRQGAGPAFICIPARSANPRAGSD